MKTLTKAVSRLLFWPLVFFFSACNGFEQVVEIEIPEHQAALSIYAHFNSIDTVLELRVGRSASILDPFDSLLLDQPVSISLYRNNQLLAHDFICQDGLCTAPMVLPFGSAGDEYRLEVSAPGWETLSAVQHMPTAPIVKNLEGSIGGAIDPDGNAANALNITLQDPAGEENYYAVEAFRFYFEYLYDNTGQIVDSMQIKYPVSLDSSDPGFSTVYTEDKPLLIGKDALFNGNEYLLRLFTSDYIMEGDQILVRVSSITRDAYLFFKSYSAYGDSQYDPFAEPVVVHQNVENGHGIFSLQNSLEDLVEF